MSTESVSIAGVREPPASPRRSWPARAALVIPAVVALLVSSVAKDAIASHDPTFHKYAVFMEQSPQYAYTYTGVLSVRIDGNFSVTAGGACVSPPFRIPVVYQTQWIIVSADEVSDWLELGTGHQNGCRYWFWGYGQNGVWNPYGWTFGVASGIERYFRMSRTFGSYEFWVGDINVWNLPSAWAGKQVELGLESYDAHAVAPVYGSRELQFTTAEGPWNYWTSNAVRKGVPPTPMCGEWTSFPTYIRTGENSPC